MSDMRLRDVRDGDLERFFEFQRDLEANRMAAFTALDPNDRVAFDAHWRRILADPTVRVRTIEREGVVAGNVLAYESDGIPEVSYWIDRGFWGQGIATSALHLFLLEFTARPLRARAAHDNAGSIRVLERCGFRRIGEGRGFANARGVETAEHIFELVPAPANASGNQEARPS